MLEALRDIGLNLGHMSRKKLIRVVAEFTTWVLPHLPWARLHSPIAFSFSLLNKVEEDYHEWAKYDPTLALYRANEMHDAIILHGLRFDCVVALAQVSLRNSFIPHITYCNF